MYCTLLELINSIFEQEHSTTDDGAWLFQVRGAAVFSLGTFISSIASRDRSDHARLIDQTVAVTLATTVTHDGSPLVRQVSSTYFAANDHHRLFQNIIISTSNYFCPPQELVVALQYFVQTYESAFLSVAHQYFMDESSSDLSPQSPASSIDNILVSPSNTLGRKISRQSNKHIPSPVQVSKLCYYKGSWIW